MDLHGLFEGLWLKWEIKIFLLATENCDLLYMKQGGIFWKLDSQPKAGYIPLSIVSALLCWR